MRKISNLKIIFYTQTRTFSILIFVFIVSSSMSAFAQATYPEAKVRKMTIETEDLIVVQVSISKNIFRRGEDIPLNYLVTNKSNKAIYLVVEPSPQVFIDENYVIELLQPVKLPDDHVRFDYDLIKILPQKIYKGNLLFSAQSYLSNKKYDFEVAEIQVGFSYLFDKSNLEDCKEVTFVRPCLKELYDKSKSLTVGNLVFEIKKQ